MTLLNDKINDAYNASKLKCVINEKYLIINIH